MSKEQHGSENGGEASAVTNEAEREPIHTDQDGSQDEQEQHGIAKERIKNDKDASTVSNQAKQEPINTDQDARQDKDENDIETLKQALETKTQEADDKIKRVQAEMENLRKRTLKDVENAHKYALKEFINELLPAIDSLELGLSALGSADNIEDIHEGMDLTLKKFIGIMEKFDIKVIDPSGEKFNPDQHEAVSTQAGQGQAVDMVVKVVQKGYQLNDRLVRPARVIVSK